MGASSCWSEELALRWSMVMGAGDRVVERVRVMPFDTSMDMLPVQAGELAGAESGTT